MGPFIKSKNNTSKIMANLLISLFPLMLFAIYKNGYLPYQDGYVSFIYIFYPLLLMVVGSFVSFVTEFVYFILTKQIGNIKNSYAIFPGLFLSLIMPLNIPIYVLVIGAFVASLSKIVFGGFGKNIFNPALIGYIFVVAAYSTFFSTEYYFNKLEFDTLSTATPLTNAAMVQGIGNYSEIVSPFGDFKNFILGFIPGSLAETSSILCILAFVFLTFTKTIKWRISVSYVSTVFIITYIVSSLLGEGIYYPLFHIFSGGLMFGAVFMATDPVTSAVTPLGQILQGIFLGILTVIFRFNNVEGVATSILIMNMLVFILDKIGVQTRFNLFKSIIWIIGVCMFVILFSILIAYSKRDNLSGDPDFNIINKQTDNYQTIYTVSQKGYGGTIKAEIILENDRITEIEVLSHHETDNKYQLIIEQDYLNELIKYQENLSDLDTISSATVTSNALKRIIINTLEDYK